MKKLLITLFGIMTALVGIVWSVFMLFIRMMSDDTADHSQKEDPYNTPNYTPENMWKDPKWED